MNKIVKYIGLDVHKNSIAIAIAEEGRQRDVNFYGVINNDMDQLQKFLRKQISQKAESKCVYEIGPCGYICQNCIYFLLWLCYICGYNITQWRY